MESKNILPESPDILTRIMVRIAVVSAVFSLITASLLLVNYIQFKRVDPLNSRILPALKDEMSKTPQNKTLREEIRDIDLLSRKAFFTSQNQLRTGSFLLLGGIVVFLLALHIIILKRKNIPCPETCPGIDNPFMNATITRKMMIGGIIFFMAMMIFTGLLFRTNLNQSLIQTKPETPRSEPSLITNNSIDNNPLSSQVKSPADNSGPELKTVIPPRDELAKYWPNFRGLDGNGKIERKFAPVHWDGKSGKNIRWKVKVPMPGYSSPIVWENRIFLSGGDKKKRQVMAFDTESGKLLWCKDVCGIKNSPDIPPKVTEDTGYAAPTMATNGQFVYAIFATGDIICFTVNGQRIWARNLGIPENHYGHSSSLMLYKDLLVVQFDHSSQTKLIGIKANAGKTLWEVKREGTISWASPIVVNTGKRTEIIVATSSLISSHDPKDGKTFWSFDCMGGEVAASPTYCNGYVYDANDNAYAVSIDTSQGKIRWKTDELDMPDVASPIATEKHLFMATSTGLLVCVDTTNGKLIWDKECEDGFYSSPILVGENIYATDLKGVTYIFKAEGTYKEVAKSKLGTSVVTTPAFVDNSIYIRTRTHLYCIEEKK